MNERNKLFDTYITDRFVARTDFSKEVLEVEFDMYEKNFKRWLPVNKTANILEIGFGTGYFLKYLEGAGYTNVVGIESSREEVDFVAKQTAVPVRYVDTITFLNENKDTFEYICMHQVLEHIPKPVVIPLLEAVYASLKKGGKFVASTPNGNNPLNINVFAADFTHEFIYNPESLGQVLRISKFVDIQVLPLRESNKRLSSKIVALLAPVTYFLLDLLVLVSRSYRSKSKIYAGNIYFVCQRPA